MINRKVAHLLYTLLILASLLVYFPALWNDFQTNWDDNWMVMNHYTENGFTWYNIKAVFTEFHVAQYGPINEVIYMTIYAAFGYNPMVYHLYPLLLHIINSCLVLLLIRRLIGNRTDITTARLVSFVTALLFAIHPMQVESVAWISASKIPLYTLFALLAMLTYIQYSCTGKAGYYIAAFRLFLWQQGAIRCFARYSITFRLGARAHLYSLRNGSRKPYRKAIVGQPPDRKNPVYCLCLYGWPLYVY
jgi:hypothetical protein